MLNSAFENRIVLAFRRLSQSCPYSCMEAAYNRAYFHSYVGGFSALSVQLSNTNKGQKQSIRILDPSAISPQSGKDQLVFTSEIPLSLNMDRG